MLMTHPLPYRTIKRWYDTVGSTQLTEDQSTQLQTAVRGNFQVHCYSRGTVQWYSNTADTA